MTSNLAPADAGSPLRVAVYMHDLSGGGVERMRLSLIEGLRARGVAVTLVLGSRTGTLAGLLPAGLDVIELGARRTALSVLPLVAYLRSAAPDILLSSLDHNNIVALCARILARGATRFVICQHNPLSAERVLGWKYRAIPFLYRLLQSQADGIVAVSEGVASDLAKLAHIPRRRVTAIYNPVIGADFDARAAAPPPHTWLAQKTCPVFVFAGRLTAQKDPKTLLHAMHLLRQWRHVRLILLGEGKMRAELEELANRLGIASDVAFAGFQADPLPWLRHADAVVCASRYEGLGNVIIEALACGTPVVSTDCPHGPAEILQNGRFGQLVAVGAPAALAASMDHCLAAPSDPDRLRAATARFTQSACTESHLRLFRRLADVRPRQVRALGMTISAHQVSGVVQTILTGPPRHGLHLLVTPNLQHVALLRDPAFAAAYRSAHLVCPDGFPVLLAARLHGLRLHVRVTGCDIFHALAEHEALGHQRLFFVVESPLTESALRHWAKLRGLCETIHVATAPAALGANVTAQDVLALAIAAASPTILIMALGAPVSEIFVHRYRRILPPCWALCLGQSVRVELGLVRRAPVAWRRVGLEWFWRLKQEPRRLAGRYARAALLFPGALLSDLWRR